MAFEQPGDLTKGMSAQLKATHHVRRPPVSVGTPTRFYASAIAWMTLPEDGFLHLEVAEDYSTLVSNTLNAVQVKATKAAITLNSKSVVDAINAFFLYVNGILTAGSQWST